MFDKIIEWDRELFLSINSFHSPFFDEMMKLFSARTPWIPLYLIIAASLFFTIRINFVAKDKPFISIQKKDIKFALIAFIGIIIAFGLSDFLSNQTKYLVERLRPGWDPLTVHIARVLEANRNSFSFVSSHATNVFGFATITSLIFRKRWYTIFIFFWALLVCYSRIYVGRHFPGDVLGGALMGFIFGYLLYRLVCYFYKRFPSKSVVK